MLEGQLQKPPQRVSRGGNMEVALWLVCSCSFFILCFLPAVNPHYSFKYIEVTLKKKKEWGWGFSSVVERLPSSEKKKEKKRMMEIMVRYQTKPRKHFKSLPKDSCVFNYLLKYT